MSRFHARTSALTAQQDRRLRSGLDAAHERARLVLTALPQVGIPEGRLERIDQSLFIPLATLMHNDSFKAPELFRFIFEMGRPESLKRHLGSMAREAVPNYKGFVLEAYVRWCLERLAKSEEHSSFTFISPGKGVLPSGREYEVNQWGNVLFFDPNRRRGRVQIAEIDCMCEFYHSGHFAPVMFEASFRDHPLHYRWKSRLVGELYRSHSDPYVCEVLASWGAHGAVIEPGSVNPLKRKIIIPNSPEFEAVAERLYKRDLAFPDL
ncbi:MAG: hypothetical protein AB1529_00415 [Candidatus Micrarchaeota archaeon]